MAIEIKVPALGESVTEATVGQWFKQPGDAVAADEPLVELETDKVTIEVPAPSAGVLTDIVVPQGGTVAVGAVLGAIDGAGTQAGAASKAAAAPAAQESPHAQKREAQPAAPPPAPKPAEPAAPAAELTLAGDGAMPAPPAARKIMAEQGLTPAEVPGSGRRGQILKQDATAAVARRAAGPAAAAAAGSYLPANVPVAGQALRAPTGPNDAAREERVRMTRLRQTIARRLKEAQNTAAMLTTFNDVDMGAIMKLRSDYKELFEKRYHVKLGFMAFFVKACVQALKEVPGVNAEIDGEDVIYKNYYHIGVAVGSERGLVVPVLREADRLSFAEIEQAIADFGRRAREGKLGIEEMQGGTFTISNGGVYGSLLSTPILNAPQSGILGMHRIEDRAVVRNGQIVARPIMNLALSYDHRLVDGREAVTFLVRVKEFLEDPQRLVLEL
jgi:2-oxoglutarate dehydrogenase E2 component (dihydrolipoamide succinyltransferase)